jgi:hypothetical protein
MKERKKKERKRKIINTPIDIFAAQARALALVLQELQEGGQVQQNLRLPLVPLGNWHVIQRKLRQFDEQLGEGGGQHRGGVVIAAEDALTQRFLA